MLQHFHQNKHQYPYSLKAVLQTLGSSKQAFHQHQNRVASLSEPIAQLCLEMDILREEDNGIGIKKAYYTLLDRNIHVPFGRCKFEEIMVKMGYKLDMGISYDPITTKSGNRYFVNLVIDYQVDNINQVWLSDSTYWKLEGNWVYATTLVDVYSRYLLALIPSQGMTAEETVIPSILSALNHRTGHDLSSCIFHSDRGGQYLDKVFLSCLDANGIRSSMSESVYENPHIERINSTIKQLLRQEGIKNYEAFVARCDIIRTYYNERRLHNGLLPYRNTPAAYEAVISGLAQSERPILTLPPKAK